MTTGRRWEPWAGVRAALAVPRWVASDRLRELLVLPTGTHDIPHPEPQRALRTTRRVLRVLAWLPGGRWRTSCLYESVAECLVLRDAGVPAAVCIGVKRNPAQPRGIEAHAWVARTPGDREFHGFSTLDVLAALRAQR